MIYSELERLNPERKKVGNIHADLQIALIEDYPVEGYTKKDGTKVKQHERGAVRVKIEITNEREQEIVDGIKETMKKVPNNLKPNKIKLYHKLSDSSMIDDPETDKYAGKYDIWFKNVLLSSSKLFDKDTAKWILGHEIGHHIWNNFITKDKQEVELFEQYYNRKKDDTKFRNENVSEFFSDVFSDYLWNVKKSWNLSDLKKFIRKKHDFTLDTKGDVVHVPGYEYTNFRGTVVKVDEYWYIQGGGLRQRLKTDPTLLIEVSRPPRVESEVELEEVELPDIESIPDIELPPPPVAPEVQTRKAEVKALRDERLATREATIQHAIQENITRRVREKQELMAQINREREERELRRERVREQRQQRINERERNREREREREAEQEELEREREREELLQARIAQIPDGPVLKPGYEFKVIHIDGHNRTTPDGSQRWVKSYDRRIQIKIITSEESANHYKRFTKEIKRQKKIRWKADLYYNNKTHDTREISTLRWSGFRVGESFEFRLIHPNGDIAGSGRFTVQHNEISGKYAYLDMLKTDNKWRGKGGGTALGMQILPFFDRNSIIIRGFATPVDREVMQDDAIGRNPSNSQIRDWEIENSARLQGFYKKLEGEAVYNYEEGKRSMSMIRYPHPERFGLPAFSHDIADIVQIDLSTLFSDENGNMYFYDMIQKQYYKIGG
jgi:hypothetical protein